MGSDRTSVGKADSRGVPGGVPPGDIRRERREGGRSPPNMLNLAAVEVGFEPSHPRIVPDFVLEYAGWGEIPKLGISCGSC